MSQTRWDGPVAVTAGQTACHAFVMPTSYNGTVYIRLPVRGQMIQMNALSVRVTIISSAEETETLDGHRSHHYIPLHRGRLLPLWWWPDWW